MTESNAYGVGIGMTTAQAEALGDAAGNAFNEMAFSLAVCAFLPGGSRFGDLRWEVKVESQRGSPEA